MFLFLCFSLMLCVQDANARNKKKPLLKQCGSAFALQEASDIKLNTTTLSFSHAWKPGWRTSGLQLGLGVRCHASFGERSMIYKSAPAALVNGIRGIPSLFYMRIAENMDTLRVNGTQLETINAFGFVRYAFNTKWSVELNLDLAGFTMGATKNATLYYGENNEASRDASAAPASRNICLLGNNNHGTLQTQLVVMRKWKERWTWQAGLACQATEYIFSKPVLYTNSLGNVVQTDRYRNREVLITLGARYELKK